MDESKVQVFIDGAKHYFRQFTRHSAEVGAPYLAASSETLAYDYTGVIGISGSRSGCVYFSAPTTLLKGLLSALGEADASPANQADLVGEVANTISGNARRVFGSQFNISVPTIVPGPLDRTRLPRGTRAFVIPLSWQKHQAGLVIALE